MSSPMKPLLPLAVGLALGVWLARRTRPQPQESPNRQAQLQQQIRQLKEGYEKQDRIRRDFTANVSHELKTPLTSISGYAEILREGMVKSEDVGRFAGKIYEEAQRLIDVTRQSFFEGIRYAKEGHRLLDISAAIQEYVESNGFSIVREYVGHGIGTQMHESPEIPNYGHPGHGPKLLRGMTIAIEPMVNAGTAAIRQMPDGWTVRTLDGKNAAHYENTILITDGEPEILTAPAI